MSTDAVLYHNELVTGTNMQLMPGAANCGCCQVPEIIGCKISSEKTQLGLNLLLNLSEYYIVIIVLTMCLQPVRTSS